MAIPKRHETIRRELKRLAAMRRRSARLGSENYHAVLGAEWALQWALGTVNARSVSTIVKSINKREADDATQEQH